MESERILLDANQDVKPEVVYERKSSIFSPVSLLLCTVFLLAVGGYWMVRTLKTGIFVAIVGLSYEPYAKLGTVAVLIPVLLFYNSLLVRFSSRPRALVYTVLGVYLSLFVVLTLFLSLPVIGIENRQSDPRRVIGWIAYWVIESFASVCIPMLWSVVATIAPRKTASSLYTMLIISAQVGAISGSTMARQARRFSFQGLFMLEAGIIATIMVLMTIVFRMHNNHNDSNSTMDSDGSNSSELPLKTTLNTTAPTGLLEGIRLIGTRRYVFGILVVSTFAEIITTIMDFQLKVIAKQEFPDAEAFASFMGSLGQAVNSVSLVFAITGTRFAIQYLGLRVCLLAFPSGALVLLIVAYFYPLIWVFFYGLVIIKAFGYSLNSPSKELLYLQTSVDVKFKSKSWIDMFGGRAAKGIGSIVTSSLRSSPVLLLNLGTGACIAAVLFWITVAQRLGLHYRRLVQSDTIIS